MTAERFRELTADAEFPMTVKLRSGDRYVLRTPHTFFISDDYPDFVIITIPGKGVVYVAVEAIDVIETQHEPAGR